jgi:hypothetical protein
MQNSTPHNAGATGTKTCVVLNKLPHGLWIEGGYSFQNSNVVRSPEYRRVMLAGANQSSMEFAAENPGVQLVSKKYFKAGVTVNVDEAFYDKWVKDHADGNIVRNKLLIKCRNLAEAMGMAKDDEQRTTGLEPRSQVPALTDKSLGTGFVPPNVSQISPLNRDEA